MFFFNPILQQLHSFDIVQVDSLAHCQSLLTHRAIVNFLNNSKAYPTVTNQNVRMKDNILPKTNVSGNLYFWQLLGILTCIPHSNPHTHWCRGVPKNQEKSICFYSHRHSRWLLQLILTADRQLQHCSYLHSSVTKPLHHNGEFMQTTAQTTQMFLLKKSCLNLQSQRKLNGAQIKTKPANKF